MSVFSRVRDIINSNINTMLDRAEDPAKLIRLMIQEMEDTLVEVKASCAGAMATRKKIQREREGNLSRAQQWAERAQLAVERGREDLAREALHEKRRYLQQAERVEQEMIQSDALVEQYQDDILQLDNKLTVARDKQRMLVQRHRAAEQKHKAQNGIRRMDSAEAVMRFEEFENRIERMEAEANLVNHGHKPTLEAQFSMLEGDDEIERELQALKSSSARQLKDSPSTP